MKMPKDISDSPLFDDLRGTLHFQLHRIQKAMFRNGNHLMQKLDVPLQMEQLPVLMVICAKKELSQQDVADILGRDKSSVMRTITTMVKKGLVTVSQDVNDKRRNNVIPTKNGNALTVKLKNIAKEAEAEALKAFSVEEKETILAALIDIADKLEGKNK
ncbi:MarR family winged helix-turn-helix transcriptional regulator [Pinibacter soli]|uniref:MarR family winged helix-turn-helix transcriptional regulator n=1 Tax=Pinibacter soli TaxID=3044211 RepID=A0ABT6RJ56_9BACT|nr:MarR family winged helix-turn-helix transcriptional regulator [Pinibacter soli]MDI3322602.1 MarR family winged helix-turn-helix transcriptional regulator [Pinibacter soli]